MLNLMRKHAGSWMIKFIIAAITLVFVFWGVGSFRDRSGSKIASVNDDVITLDAYRQAYNTMMDRLRQTFGDNLNDELLKSLQIRKQTMKQLIDQKLLQQQAEKMQFQVTDKELADAIADIPAFQTAGVFDPRVYNLVLSRNRLTPDQFEVIQRESMMVEKVRSLILDGVRISDAEAWEWYQWQNASVDIAHVAFSPDGYKDVSVTDADVTAYFGKNSDVYKTEPKMKVRYLHFNPENYRNQISVSADEIAEYYSSHTGEFETPETVEARHILLRVGPDADPAVVAQKQTLALEIAEKARNGEDFAALAKAHSEGPSGKEGGYLGTFKKEDMVAPFADAAFSLTAGQISDPVRTDFGWHVIKVEKHNPSSTISLGDASEGIHRKLADQRAKTMAFDHAESVYSTVFEGDDIVKAAEAEEMTLHVSDYFTRKGPMKVGDPAEFGARAFLLEKMQISDIIEMSDGFYLMQALDIMVAEVPPLEDVLERVKKDVTREKQEKAARGAAQTFLDSVIKSGGWKAAVASAGVAPVTTGWFGRDGSIPGIGYAPAISAAAFKLSDEDPYPEGVLDGPNGVYVIRFLKRKAPESDAFEAEKETVKSTLLQQKQTTVFNNWLESIRKKSEITIEPGFLE